MPPWSAKSKTLSGGFALFAAVATLALTACGAGGSPGVASVKHSTGGSSGSDPTATAGSVGGSSPSTPPPSTPPATGAAQLLVEWASCMRAHGDTAQADPTIDAKKVIHIPWDPAMQGGVWGTNKGGQGNSGPGQYCRSYLTAAATALRGGRSQRPPDQAAELGYSECMRANGIAGFPDPTASGLVLSMNAPGDLNPHDPTFQRASRLCARKTGVRGFGVSQPGMIELSGSALP